MKNTKTTNKQKFINSQKNINIKACGDVNNGIINHQEIVDNSWYSIPKAQTNLYEMIGKFIISKLGEKGGLIFSIFLMLIGLIVSFISSFKYLGKLHYNPIYKSGGDFKSIFTNIFSVINIYWFLGILGFLLCILGWIIIRSIEHKNNSQCPKCKKPYSLVEVGESKEKEIKTSKGYRVTQIRNYKCKNCKFEKKDESSFTRPLD